MKILHVITSLDVGGAETALARLVCSEAGEPERGHSVICLGSLGRIGIELRRKGVDIVTLEMRSPTQLPIVFYKLYFLIRSARPDIVQTWLYHSDLIGGVCARLAKCQRVIWNIRNSDLNFGNGLSRRTAFVVALCAKLSYIIPSAIVCVAERSRVRHIAIGFDKSKISVIGNGFNADEFGRDDCQRKKIRERLGVPSESLVIGTVARFNEYKDHFNFVKAAKILQLSYDNLYFVMVGRGVDHWNVLLKNWISSTVFPERFLLLGECDNVKDLYSSFDVFCLHSMSEGFPNVLGEAMCAGLPCVATDVGDAAILLGDTGLIVPSEDTLALATALDQVLRKPAAARNELGRSARQRVENQWTIAKVKQSYRDLYIEMINA